MEDINDRTAVVPFYKLFMTADALDYIYMLGGTLGAMTHGLALPIFLLIFKNLLNSFGEMSNNMYHEVSKYTLYFVYLGIVTMFASWAEVALWMQTGERQVAKLRIKYLEAMLKQDIGYFDIKARTGDIVDTVSTSMLVIQEAISEKMGNFIHFFFTFVGGVVVGFTMIWRLGLVTLAVLPLIAAIGGFHLWSLTNLHSQNVYSKAGNIAEEMLAQIRTVYSFVGEQKAVVSYSNALRSSLKLGFRSGTVKGFGVGAMYMTILLTYAFLLWYGGVLVHKGQASGASVLATIFAVMVASISLGQASPNIGILAKARVAAFTITEAINRVPTIDSKASGIELLNVDGHLELNDVYFSYPSRPDVKVFQGFSLVIPAGTSMAIVGSSGSGKSTVMALIQRFYDPTSGQVLLDGHDIKTVQLKWLRSQIGLVTQEPALFSTSILQNILYGNSNAKTQEIEDAAKAANAHNFISQLPDGYNTQVGERGVQLSGGQKQRIAIVRALIRKPSMLLLDEATSALDAESEQIVQDALDKIMAEKTTVIIAHRLSTIKNANKIAVVQEGKVAELGKHHELLCTAEGAYATLVRLQEMSKKSAPAVISSSNNISSTFQREASCSSSEIAVEHSTVPETSSYFLRLVKMNMSEWPYLLMGSTAAILAGLITPTFAFIISLVLKVYYNPDKSYANNQIAKYSIVFICLGVTVFGIEWILYYSFDVSGEILTMRVREMMFKAITTFEIGWFDQDENGSSQVASRLATNAAYVRSAMGDRVSVMLQNMSLLISAFAIAFFVEWKVALVISITLPLIAWCFISEQMFLKGFAGNIAKAHEQASRLTTEALSNLRIVAALNAEEKVVNLVIKELEVPKRSSFVRGQIAGAGYGVSSLFFYSSFALGLWFGALQIKNGKTDFESVMKVFFVLVISSSGIGETIGLTPDIVKGANALKSVFTIIDRKSEIEPNNSNQEKAENLNGEIEIRRVHFCYPSRPQLMVLKGLSLTVHTGDCLALVGASGSGKSSVIALLERFYDPTSGKIMVDGKDIKYLNLWSYRRHVGLVQQEPALFATSIYENIQYAKEGATEAEIIEAAKAANAHNFISALPDGYNTYVGERGVQLSGGQKQRIAIARVVLKDPSILLLDEATSALDAESEGIVQETLHKLMKGRTTIVVAHRLSTIQNADEIAVIQDGNVVEQGSHLELLGKADGAYAQLVRLQQQ